MKAKLSKLKAKEQQQQQPKANNDPRREQPLAPTSVPSLYDNSALFQRETVEKRLDKHMNMMGEGQAVEDEEAPKQSWIQIKAAAMDGRKKSGASNPPSQKTLHKKRKIASQPKNLEEKRKTPLLEEANHLDKTEAPSDPTGVAVGKERGQNKIEEERKSGANEEEKLGRTKTMGGKKKKKKAK